MEIVQKLTINTYLDVEDVIKLKTDAFVFFQLYEAVVRLKNGWPVCLLITLAETATTKNVI